MMPNQTSDFVALNNLAAEPFPQLPESVFDPTVWQAGRHQQPPA